MAGNLARGGYVGPTLAQLLIEAIELRPANVGTMQVLVERVAQELQVRLEAARGYAEREGSIGDLRVRLERDELRALVIDFVRGVIE